MKIVVSDAKSSSTATRMRLNFFKRNEFFLCAYVNIACKNDHFFKLYLDYFFQNRSYQWTHIFNSKCHSGSGSYLKLLAQPMFRGLGCVCIGQVHDVYNKHPLKTSIAILRTVWVS